jgi:SAM-dependent methyltransferase
MAGIRPGMRILDIGCGPGDLTMLAARLAGASGSVIGVDADADVLAVAERRALEAGLGNVSFRQARIPDIRLDRPADALVGRLILLHLEDPAADLRAMSRLVRPGGVVAFQEFNISRTRSVPPLPLAGQCTEWICDALRAGGRDPDFGEQLFSIFRQAGLPGPEMMVAIPAVDSQAACEYFTATVGSLLPVLEKAGIASRDEIDLDTLAGRLWAEVRGAGALVILPELVGAWVQTPGLS